MYTTRTIKNGIQERRCSPDLRRCMCAALAIICAFCLCINPIPVNAIATETIIISGIIAAMMVSLGVELINVAGGFDGISQAIYDGWRSYAEENDLSDNDILQNAAIVNNKLVLANKSALKLNDFVKQQQNRNVDLGITYNLNGENIPTNAEGSVPIINLAFDTGYSIKCKDSLYHTYVVKVRPNSGNNSYDVYIDGVWKDFWTNSSPVEYSIGWAIMRTGNLYCYGGGSFTTVGSLPYANNENLTPLLTNAKLLQSVSNRQDIDFGSRNITIDIGAEDINSLAEFSDVALSDIVENQISGDITFGGEIPDIDVPDQPTQNPDLDDYDFTTLGNLLSRKFPFSIPNDIKLAAQMLHYQAEAPVWTFQPLDVPGVPDAVAAAEVTIDLSDDTYAPWLAILRWGIVILYVAGLASATKNLIFE